MDATQIGIKQLIRNYLINKIRLQYILNVDKDYINLILKYPSYWIINTKVIQDNNHFVD